MHNQKSLKIALVILGVFVLGVFVFYYFLYKDIQFKSQHTANLLNDLSLEANKQAYITSTEQIIKDITPDINRISNSIISKDGDVQFIESLESLAHENDLVISIDSLNLENNPELASSSIVTLRVKIKTTGSWGESYKFLTQLESLPLKIKVDGFDLRNAALNTSPEIKKISNFGNSWQSSFEIAVLKYN